MLRKLILAVMVACGLVGCSLYHPAGNANDSAREIMAKYQDAVVFVSGVAKIQAAPARARTRRRKRREW